MILYHFTCAHGAKAIGKRGHLRPNPNAFFGVPAVVWLTDQAQPQRDAVGLTSVTLPCDRLAYRYRTENGPAVRWDDWKRTHVPTRTIEVLESYAEDGPRHWWVSERPLVARR